MAERFIVLYQWVKYKGKMYCAGELLPPEYTNRDRYRFLYPSRIGLKPVTVAVKSAPIAVAEAPAKVVETESVASEEKIAGEVKASPATNPGTPQQLVRAVPTQGLSGIPTK